MELWIRSQDKNWLMPINDIISVFQKSIFHKGIILGQYKSEERALEVLDEIQNILKPQLLVRRNDDNDKVLLGALHKGVTQKLDMEFKELSTYVYEMPKE